MKIPLFKKTALILMTIAISLGANATEKKKPNIVLIYADDISAREFPIYGSTKWSPAPQGGDSTDVKFRAKTPVLDKLAKEGLWVKTAWATTICSPSRAMMMSGRYAHLHKWWHNKDKGLAPDAGKKKKQWELHESTPHSIADIAKKGGYTTYWAGKTQMGGVDEFGFDEGIFTPGSQSGLSNKFSDFKIINKKINGKRGLLNTDTGANVDYYQQFGWYWQPHVELMNHPSNKEKFEWWPNNAKDKAEYGLHTYGPDVELKYIFDFMDRKSKGDKPFFIYHTTHLGHDGWDFFSDDISKKTRQKWPGTPKIEWKNGKYIRTTPKVTGDKAPFNTHGTVTEGGMHDHVNYLDYQVWLYIEKLKAMGELENTIFIVTADNGSHGYGKGTFQSQRGTHVPLIIYAPGQNLTKQGEQDVLVNMSDFLPTIADIAGVKIPDSYEINGESLMPFLTTDKKDHRDWIYAYHMKKQLIRGKNVLIDGANKIYDVANYPADLTSFPEIKNIKKMSKAYQEEYKKLVNIKKRYAQTKANRNAPEGGIGKVEPLTKL